MLLVSCCVSIDLYSIQELEMILLLLPQKLMKNLYLDSLPRGYDYTNSRIFAEFFEWCA